SPLDTASVRYLAPGHTYQFRVQAVDAAGNPSVVSTGPSFSFGAVQETDASIAYSIGWQQRSATFALGGALETTSVAGATATFSFTGTDVAWVSTRGTDRGMAEVRIDGV